MREQKKELKNFSIFTSNFSKIEDLYYKPNYSISLQSYLLDVLHERNIDIYEFVINSNIKYEKLYSDEYFTDDEIERIANFLNIEMILLKNLQNRYKKFFTKKGF